MVTLAIEYIVSEPNVFSGRPHIRGRRIGVDHIASYSNAGWTIDFICEQLELSPAEVHAALSYYFAHKNEIDRSIERANAIPAGIPNSYTAEEVHARIEQRFKERGLTLDDMPRLAEHGLTLQDFPLIDPQSKE